MPLYSSKNTLSGGPSLSDRPHASTKVNLAGKKPVKSLLNSRNSECQIPDTREPIKLTGRTSPPQELLFGAFRNDFPALSVESWAVLHHPEQFKLLPLLQAAPMWLEEKKLHIRKERTREAYELYIRNLVKHLGQLQLCSLHIGHILSYQQIRRAEKACVSYVNHETNCLAQILKRADLWDLIAKQYKPLPAGNWTPPKVLSAEDEERFFRIAAANPSWAVAYWAVALTNNTSAVGTELRNLQLKHIQIDRKPPTIHIPDDKVKNEFRARVVPLNAEAEAKMRHLIDRAKKLGACRPEDYIFPKRVKRNQWDVTKPGSPSFIRWAFREMREAMGPGYEWLKPRNFRNQLITKLFENGEADETIISIAGHQHIRMSRFYSRIRVDAKFEALSALGPRKKAVENAG